MKNQFQLIMEQRAIPLDNSFIAIRESVNGRTKKIHGCMDIGFGTGASNDRRLIKLIRKGSMLNFFHRTMCLVIVKDSGFTDSTFFLKLMNPANTILTVIKECFIFILQLQLKMAGLPFR